jgi:hypothetical protein
LLIDVRGEFAHHFQELLSARREVQVRRLCLLVTVKCALSDQCREQVSIDTIGVSLQSSLMPLPERTVVRLRVRKGQRPWKAEDDAMRPSRPVSAKYVQQVIEIFRAR